MIRLSTCEKRFFEYDPPKDAKTKRSFHGVSRHFRTFKVPTKPDGGKPSLIWTQWTWKPSPRSIGFDADENGQSRQVQRQIPIHPVGYRSYLIGRDPQCMISSHAGQKMNRRLLRLPLVTSGRMRKDPRRNAERMLGVRLLQKKYSGRNATRVGEPAHGNINLASEI